MVGKSGWAARHGRDLRAKGIGFVPAMESLGVISKADADEGSRKSRTQDMETLLLGHPRLGRLGSNSNYPHRDSSNAHETQTTASIMQQTPSSTTATGACTCSGTPRQLSIRC